MDRLTDLLRTLPLADWLAVALFFGGWVGYATFARRRSVVRPSLLALTNRERRRWMLQTTWRDNRVIDGVVVQNLSTSPSFFASTTILIIGGLLAVLSTTEKASELVAEIPFAARTSALVFDLKVVLLTAIFVYAFFRFTWSLRQFNLVNIMVGAFPAHRERLVEDDRMIETAGRLNELAGLNFTQGLRAYYYAVPMLLWLVNAWLLLGGSLVITGVLYYMEFRSATVRALGAG